MNTHDRPGMPYRARRHVWLRAGEPLVCVNGHRLKHNAALLDHGAFICSHQATGHGGHTNGPCNARSYVLQFPGGLRFVAEVSVQEMLQMRDAAMSVEDVISFLRGSAA